MRNGPPIFVRGLHGLGDNLHQRAIVRALMSRGDELWLERARAFAVHAAEQVEQSRTENGRGRHTLWTGDLGAALYLRDCIDGSTGFPTLDYF